MPFPTLEEPVPAVQDLVVTPNEADAFVAEIRELPSVDITNWPQHGGRTANQVTLGCKGKPHIYFTRPHAHEPAGTAACFEWVRRLSREQKTLWSSWVLGNFRLSFMADANPTGSQRSPVKFWDGSEVTNETFFLWMFGESGEAAGERFPRVDTWDVREVTPPRLIGIAYEQIDEHIYVEPNRDHRSTFFKAYFDLNEQEPIDVWIDLHQTEYVGSDRNTHINLPTNFDDLRPELRVHYQSLGEHIHGRWRKDGAAPRDQPQRPYRDNHTQRDFLNAVWSSITPRTLHLVTEVQNNNSRTPISDQVRFQMAAMDETLRYVDACGPALMRALDESRRAMEDEA